MLGFLSTLVVKNLPAVQETWLQSLGQEDPLEWSKEKFNFLEVADGIFTSQF